MARRRRGKSEPLALEAVLSSVYPRAEPQEIAALRAFGWWTRVVPERVAKNARPVRFARGVLTVHAATSAWAQELDFARESLLASVRRRLPDVRRIRVVVGPLPDLPTRHRGQPAPAPVEPLERLPDEVARALAAVQDDGLRAAIADAAATALSANEDEGAAGGSKRPR